MKIRFLKSNIETLFLLLVFLLTTSFYAQHSLISASENLHKISPRNTLHSYLNNQNSNKRSVFAAPASTITGNFSICLPGPNTTQLTGSGTPAAVNPWVSSNPAVATISNTGLVTSVAFGVTTITYTDNLGNTTSENVYVSTFPTITGASSTCAGGQIQLTGSVFPNVATPWSSSNPSVATVDNTGLVDGVSGGTAVITYMNLGGCTITKTITINPLIAPTITCGVTTFNQIIFNWGAVPAATTYVVFYSINGNPYLFGAVGNIFTYTLLGLLPGDSVQIAVTPSGPLGTCFTSGFQTCVTQTCSVASTPSAPTVGTVTIPTCSTATGSVQLTGLIAGAWTLHQSGTVINTITGSGLTTTINGLAPGNYTFTLTNSFGCTSTATANINIPTQPLPATSPVIGAITSPTCNTATGSVDLSGLPAGAWTINQSGTVINTIAGSGVTTTIAGLVPGNYTFTLTNSAGCTSLATAIVNIPTQPLTPPTPIIGTITPPTCSTATGSVDLSGLPAGTWTINQSGTVVNAIAGTGTTTTITGLVAGNYTFTVTNSVGCTSLATANVNIPTQPITPSVVTVGTITPPTCSVATGSVNLSGLPAGTWTINQSGTVINSIAGSGATTTIAGLVAGNYTFTLTNSVGCTSLATANVTIPTQPITPAVITVGAITPPTCSTATGSVDLSGLPAGAWTINQSGTVINSIAGSGATTTIAGLVAGNYTFTVTNSVGCTSLATANVTIPTQPITPAVITVGAITPPTCSTATGSVDLSGLPAGAWTINQSGTVVNSIAGTGATTTIAGLVPGNYTFTVTNSVGCTSLATANVTIPTQPITPAVITVGTITPPTCSVATGSVNLSGLPAGAWTINQSGTVVNAIAGSGATTTIAGLVAGNYTFTVTNSVGCTSLATAIINIPTQPITPAVITVGTITPPTCSVATGSVDLSGLPAGAWTINQSGTVVNAIAGSGATTTIAGLVAGNYTFTVTNSVGCTSLATANVTIPTQPITPAVITVGAITPPTCSTATGSVDLSGLPAGTWTINQSGTVVNAIAGSGATTTIAGLVAGNYTFTVTNSVGCTSLATANVTIPTQPITPAVITVGTITPPTCSVATGSVDLSGLPAGTWTINQSGTVVNAIAGSGATTTITGLVAGNYTFTVTNSVGCTSLATANVNIPTQPVTPVIPTFSITLPTCSVATGSVDLSGLPAGTWTINQSGTVVNAIAGTGTTTTITGLVAGNYTFTLTNSVGCTSLATANVTIPTQPITPAVVTVGTITPPTCSTATGSVDLSGLPAGAWTINQSGTVVNAIAGSGATTTIAGLVAGNYTFTLTNSVGCTSLATANVTIPTQPITPAIPTFSITLPTCNVATGSVDFSGLPAGAWTINQSGTAINAIVGSGATTTIAGLVAGNYTFTVTNSVGCTSLATANVTIPTQPITPAVITVGTITPPTCSVATGSVDLSGLPAGAWTINQSGTVVNAIAGSGATTTIAGLVAGNYTFTVTNSVGCTSLATANVTIPTQPITPAVITVGAITPPTCSTATGSVDLSGLPAGAWTINQSGTVVNAIAGSGATTTISGLVAGNYTFTVTNSVGCTSSATANVNIPTQPITPAIPTFSITLPTCSVATGSVDFSGLPAGAWTINQSGTVVNAIAGTGTTTTISGLVAGNYTFTLTNSVGCTSLATANVNIPTQPVTPVVLTVGTITPPTCSTATGSVDLSGLPAGAWTINQSGTVINSIAGSGATTTITGLVAGNYTFTVTNSVGCTSLATANVNIPTQPITPSVVTVGTITLPTCSVATGSVNLSGLPAGTWTINQSGTVINSIAGSGATTTIAGLVAGNYTFTLTNSVGCTSLASANVTIPTQPITPAVITVGAITPPTCSTATGSVDLSGLPAGAWTINQSGTVINSIAGSGATTTIAGLVAGNYTFTVTNSVGCTSLATANVTIPTQPITPAVITVGAITPPTCSTATGSVDLSGLPAGAWTINQSGTVVNSIAGSGATTTTTTIAGLVPGNYTFTVTNSVGCTSLATANVTIPTQPITPAVITVGTITPPTCSVATGSVDLSGLPAGAWTINQSGTVVNAIAGSGATTTTIAGLVAGNYTFTVTNSVGCTSLATAIINIPTQPITPAVITVGTITPPTCSTVTGSVDLSGLPAGAWTINQSGTVVNAIAGSGATTTITGLVAGNYTFTVTNSVGCTSLATANVNIPTQPVTPVIPTFSITLPTCSVATGSVDLSGLPAGTWTINQSGTVVNAIAGTGTTTTITGLVAGNYTFTVTNSVGCTSLATANVTIPTQPITPSVVTVGTITPPTCSVATGSVNLSGLPAGTWTINQSGTVINSIAGSGATTTIAGLVAGNYTFTLTNSVGCTSLATANVTIPTQPITPAVITVGAITPPTCSTATGSVDLSGLPAGAWTINQSGTVINSIAGSGATTTIAGLVAGNYTFTVTNSVGCTSLATANVTIPTQPITPAVITVGAITPPTCSTATGSVDLSGLPAGAWTINQSGTVVNAIAGSGATTTIAGLVAGNYTFTVTNSVGCTSLATANVTIPTQPITPAVITVGAITPPTCSTATGSVDLSGLPAGAWTINQSGTVINSIAGSGATTTIAGLVAGNYTFTVTNSVGCTSSATANVNIPTQPITPAIPTFSITLPTCSVATGSVDFSGLPAGAWTINQSGTVVNAIAGTGTTTTISGLVAGNYTFTLTNSVGCTSLATANVNIPTQPVTPVVLTVGTITPPTCSTATGSVDLSGLPTGAWTINQSGTVVNAIAGSGATTTIAGLVAGNYTFTLTNSVGCTSLATANVTIPTQPITPAVITVVAITPPTCSVATGSVNLSGLPAGAWTINQSGTVINAITGNGAITTIAGLVAGNYTFSVTNSVGCTSSASINVNIPIQPVAPAPPAFSITLPTCTINTGSVLITAITGLTYSFDNGPYSTTLSYIGLAAGSIHTITAKNIATCISAATTVNIPLQPVSPLSPTLTPTQPTCTLSTGSVTITPVSGETYSFDGGPYINTLVYTGLTAGSTHTVKAKNTFGCLSPVSNITLSTQPTTPLPPTITPTQPTCTDPTGSIIIAPVLGETYSLDGGTFSTNLIYTGLAAGSTHNVTAKNTVGCISSTSTITLNIQPPTPTAPSYSIIPPNCSNPKATITINAVAGELYSFDGGPYSNTLIFGNLDAGSTHTITAQNALSCISAITTITIIAQPITPNILLMDGVICIDQATGTTINPYLLDTHLDPTLHTFIWYLNGSVIGNATSTLQATLAGVYGVQATNIVSGCQSPISQATVTESLPGQGIIAEINGQFSNDPSITVTVTLGNAIYSYQLDYGPIQNYNVFTSVPPGTHTIKVTDENGCTNLSLEVTVLGYPNYFTPNGDGINDTWNIIGLRNQPNAVIHIFDRYGKLIKQISPSGNGWDGTFNTQQLPSTDYWFTVEYEENQQQKEYKGHFSLVR